MSNTNCGTEKFWQRKALIPACGRFFGRRLLGAGNCIKEGAIWTGIGVVACGTMAYTPLSSYSPLTTQQSAGQVISFEETGSHNIPTFVVDNGTDTEVVYKNLDGEWSQIVETEVGVTVQPAPNVQTSLQSIVKNHNAEIAPAEGSIVQSSTFFPTFR